MAAPVSWMSRSILRLVDPNNPVVKLCAAGMAAEGEGRRDDARVSFEQAWAQSRDDFEACIAAPTEVEELLRVGAEKARAVSGPFIEEIRAKVGIRRIA